jgi:hypothetical protein
LPASGVLVSSGDYGIANSRFLAHALSRQHRSIAVRRAFALWVLPRPCVGFLEAAGRISADALKLQAGAWIETVVELPGLFGKDRSIGTGLVLYLTAGSKYLQFGKALTL